MSELRPDSQNANLGTQRGRTLVRTSLEKYGAGRSILVTADGSTIAGAQTLGQAEDIGMPVRIIDTDGSELIALRRTDLQSTDVKARELGIIDNRASELGLMWDIDRLDDDDLDLGEAFTDDELAAFHDHDDDYQDEPSGDQSAQLRDSYQVLVTCASEQSQAHLLERLTDEGFDCKALMT